MAKQKKRKDGYYKRTFTFNGRKHYVYAKTQAELDDKIAVKKAELSNKVEKRENPTVSEYYERWQAARENTVSENTTRTQNHSFNIMAEIMIPSIGLKFGKMKLHDVTIDDLRYIQGELQKNRVSRTVNDYMSMLRHIFSDACKERVLDYNPSDLIKRLKRTEEVAVVTYHRALTKEEEKLFFEYAKDSYYYNVFLLARYSGMRIGEIGALFYGDIKGGFIHVERTITRTVGGGYTIGHEAKTAAGKRKIPVFPAANEAIIRQKTQNYEIYGGVVDMNETIFKAPMGGLLKAGQVDREIKQICKKTGIEPFTAHAFRDTFATWLVERGVHPKIIQEWMGHTNYNFTYNKYVHLSDDIIKKEMDKLTQNIAIQNEKGYNCG